MPDDCETGDAAFEQLKNQQNINCFNGGYYPINSMTYRIIKDVRNLRGQLEREIQLRQDQSDNDLKYSFNFGAIEAIITTDDK